MHKDKNQDNKNTYTFFGVTTPPNQHAAPTDAVDDAVEKLMDTAAQAITKDSSQQEKSE